MRRIISLFLALACIAGLCACSSEHTVLKLKDESILYYIAEGDYIDSQEDIDLYFEAYSTSDPEVYKNAISWSKRYDLVGMYAAKAIAPGTIVDDAYFTKTQPATQEPVNTAPTVPIDDTPVSTIKNMTTWLNEKYNVEFTHEFTSAGASVFSAESLLGLVQCFNRNTVQQVHPELAHLYTEPYADNGYMIINNTKAAAYYRNATHVDFGVSRILCYIDIIADPSSVTKDMSYEDYLSVINGISIPECIILTDKTLSSDELEQLEKDLIATGNPVAIRVFTMEADKQAEVAPSDIMQLGSGYKDVQYRKVLNAD